MSEHKVLSVLTAKSIGKVVSLEVFELDDEGKPDMESGRQTYIGTLTGLYHDKNGMVLVFQDFETPLVIGWKRHLAIAEVHNGTDYILNKA